MGKEWEWLFPDFLQPWSEAHPILPPPLILFCHLKMLLDKFSGRRKKGRFRADRGLKLFLNENEEENLHDWEEDLVDDYYRLRRREDGKRFEERITHFIKFSVQYDTLGNYYNVENDCTGGGWS